MMFHMGDGFVKSDKKPPRNFFRGGTVMSLRGPQLQIGNYLQSFLNSSATNWTLGPIMT